MCWALWCLGTDREVTWDQEGESQVSKPGPTSTQQDTRNSRPEQNQETQSKVWPAWKQSRMQGNKGKDISVSKVPVQSRTSEGTEGDWCIIRIQTFTLSLEQAHLRSDNTVTHLDQDPLKFLTALFQYPSSCHMPPSAKAESQNVCDTASSCTAWTMPCTQSTCIQEAPQCGLSFTSPSAPPHGGGGTALRAQPVVHTDYPAPARGLYFQNLILILRNTVFA